ncbi:MAG: PD40 domain-containing protein [Bacteroidales bacterium]|nr:PD40 domain-containing protein [Bacteroidales bacterium]
MKKILTLLFVSMHLLSLSQNNNGQSQLQFNYTENIVFTEDFSGAIRMYKQMISFDPKNPIFYYKLGFSYLNTFGKQDSAVIFLNKANNLYNDDYRADLSPFEIKFYLARAYRLQENTDSAIILLETILAETQNDQMVYAVNRELDMVKLSVKNMFSINDLDSVINSSFSDHSPIYFEAEKLLIFTSRRYNSNSIKYDDGQYDEDIYYSKRINGVWSSPILFADFYTPANEATSCLTPDGAELVIYKDDDRGSIYISSFVDDAWLEPVKLPSPINSRHRETHASLTADGNQMFFTSDRSGGMGGLDIWTSYKLSDGWTKPVNLGAAVNSRGDEDSPNISLDGKTLYFSSDGRDGFGGFDIFRSTLNDFGTWNISENLGYPINSIGDDIFFSPILSTGTAFYSSFRSGTQGDADIFVVYLDSTELSTKSVNIGFLFDENNVPIDTAEIIIYNKTKGQRFLANPSAAGKFIFVTEANNDYTLVIKRNNVVLFTDSFNMPDTVPKEMFYKNIVLTNL